jgi:hypothetical protein
MHPIHKLLLHGWLIDQCLTILADTVCTIIVALYTNAARFIALWANQHDIRDIKRSFELDPTRVNRSSLRLDLSLVLSMDVYTLHNHPVFVWQDLNYFTALALFFNFPANYFNGITLTNLDSHRSLLDWPKALPGPAIQFS